MQEETLFHEALEKPASERAAFLEQACGGDTQLRRRVEVLLRAHSNPTTFLGQLPFDADVTSDSPRCADADAPLASHVPVEETGSRIDRYKLLQKLGEGGMGVVWVAQQQEPVKRRVALKVIKPGMDSAQVLRRFEAERQALAMMDHHNIAKVLDAGTTAEGRPYFVMELVKGVPITKYCDELQLKLSERLSLFIPVCQAIQHAHQKGIIHRDIKPSNVLVAVQDGVPVPKVIDFGVAKALHQQLTEQSLYTEVGQIVGTLEYMSPEQAELSALDIDTRTDVYALGVLLYELLTGTTPLNRKRLGKAAYLEMVRIIKEEDPPKPSTRLSESKESLPSLAAQRHTEPARLAKDVRGELDWIAMKCLEKDRSRRYESASDLARDVERYLADEAVQACPPRASYKLSKFVRKYRVALATTLAFAVLLMAGTVISTWQAVQATRARHDAETARHQADRAWQEESRQRAIADERRVESEQQRTEAQQERAAAERALTDMYVTKGLAESDRGEPAKAILWFANAARVAKSDSERGHANYTRFRSWSRDIVTPLLAIPHPGEGIKRIAFDPTGRHFLALTEKSKCTMWRLPGGDAVPLPGGDRPVSDAVWSPSGTYLALATPAGEVDIYSVPSGERVRHFDGFGSIEVLAFSQNGRYLALAGEVVRIWDFETKDFVGAELPHPKKVLALTFNDRTDRIATLCADGFTRVFAIADKTSEPKPLFAPLESILPGPPDYCTVRPIFVNDELLTVNRYRTLIWTNTVTGKEIIRRISDPKSIRVVVGNPNGRNLLVGGSPGARLWDIPSAQLVGDELRHSNEVYSAAFSPDGAAVLTVGADRMARISSVPTGKPLFFPVPHQNDIEHAAFSPNGQLLATAQADGLVRVWTLTRGNPQDRLLPIDAGLTLAKLSPDGRHVITTGEMWSNRATIRRAQIYDLASGKMVGPGLNVGGLLNGAEFSPEGRCAATIASTVSGRQLPGEPDGKAGRLQLWEWRTGKPQFDSVPMPSDPFSLAYSPDGNFVAVACRDGQILVVDTTDGRLALSCEAGTPEKTNSPSHGVRFTPDGQSFVSWGTDSSTRVWHTATGQLRYSPLRHEQNAMCAEFSPDGRLLATGSRDHSARVWDFATGKSLVEPLQHPDYVFSVCFSSDGKQLLTGCRDGSARLWDWRKGTLLCPPLKHSTSREVWSARFAPDERSVLTCHNNGFAWLWELPTGKPIAPPLPIYNSKLGLFTPDGQYAVLGARTPHISLFHLGDLGAKDDLAVDDLTTLGELLSGHRLYEGDLAGLTSEEWMQRWSAWSQRHPADARLQPEDPLVWHRYQLEQNQAIKQWLLVAWHLDRLIEISPNDWKLWSERAIVHTELGEWDKVLAGYKKILELSPDHALSHNNLAWLLLICPDQKFRDATVGVKHATRAVELEPKQYNYWNTLGVAQYRTGNWRSAIESLQKAEDLAPGFLTPANALYLAMSHWQLNEKEAARSWFAKALKWEERFHASNEDNKRFIADANAETAELLGPEETLSVLQASLVPHHVRTLQEMRNLANAYRDHGQYSKAEPLYRERWNQHVIHWPTHLSKIDSENLLGVCLMLMGKFEEAERHLLDSHRDLQTVGETVPSTWQGLYCYRLAALYDRWKKPDSATEWRIKAPLATDRVADLPSDDPGRASLLSDAGKRLLEQQKYVEAESLFREALAIREKTPDTWQLFDTHSLLGASLLGQKKLDLAEPLLLQGYEGLKKAEANVPAEARPRITEAHKRLVQLDDARQAKPGAEQNDTEGSLGGRLAVLHALAAEAESQHRLSDAVALLTRAMELNSRVVERQSGLTKETTAIERLLDLAMVQQDPPVDWTALENATPLAARPGVHLRRIFVTAKAGRYVDATQQANQILATKPQKTSTLIILARTFALSATTASQDQALGTEQRAALSQQYVTNAVASLDQALHSPEPDYVLIGSALRNDAELETCSALDAHRQQVAQELIRIPDAWLWDFVWLKNSKKFEWTIETNLSLEGYKTKQQQLNQTGFNPRAVLSCRRTDGTSCFAGVWIQGEPSSRAVLHLTAAESQAEFNARGTALTTYVTVLFDGTQHRHSFIFAQSTNAQLWECRTMSTAEAFQALLAQNVRNHRRPVLVNIDKQPGKDVFRGLWQADGVPFRYDGALTLAEFRAALSSQPAGWRPGSVDAYNEAGERRYAVVWINDDNSSEWIATTVVPTRDVPAEIERQRRAGYYPALIHADPAPVGPLSR